MKKLIALILAVLILFVGFLGYNQFRIASSEEGLTLEDYSESTTDYDRMFREHDPEEIVLRCGERDCTWSEYFYFYYKYASQVESMIQMMPLYYGTEVSWDDYYDEAEGITFAQAPAVLAEEELRTFAAIEKLAEEQGIRRDGPVADKVNEIVEEYKQSYQVETEEELFAALAEQHVDRKVFDLVIGDNVMAEMLFEELYGAEGEKLDDGEAVKFLEDNGYVHVMHILLMTMDPGTGETAGQDAAAQKLELAESIAEELKAIKDPQEKLARFSELEQKYNEDGGCEYCFTERTMVQEFRDASVALKEYEVSDPVETAYGYHVILRLPQDGSIEMADSGNTAKYTLANEKFNEKILKALENFEAKYVPGFRIPQIADFVK